MYICSMKLLLIDNHDSFVCNILGLLESCRVARDCVDVARPEEAVSLPSHPYAGVILSPGPGLPSELPGLMRIVEEYAVRVPMLGICLGHQAIAQHFGARLEQRPYPSHGHGSHLRITDTTDPLLGALPPGSTVGRYHSWQVEAASMAGTLLRLTSVASDDGAVMSLRHARLPVYGVQFHPESIITTCGCHIMSRFIAICSSGKSLPKA
ncbi:MAG: aminodeoxychorismate/anthranilate synthase component II [Muribaculaceae bacterium]|nr:aminodeoxychorismate/anthranilate synthase component II [Muribaculaceae bacterium]MDE7080784.1 aminodeoxychorismate/anthranilate synthase component II [Muribaculaceae bacterium]